MKMQSFVHNDKECTNLIGSRTLRNAGSSLHLSSNRLIGFVSSSIVILAPNAASDMPKPFSLEASREMSANESGSSVVDRCDFL